MADLKTQKNDAHVTEFLDGIANEQQRADAREVAALMQDVTGEPPAMWGASIVGFGSYHYKYASGREGDWMLTGFAPRKQALTLYIMSGFKGEEDLMERLGKYKTGKSCLYVKRLDDVDRDVLRQLVERSVAAKREEDRRNRT